MAASMLAAPVAASPSPTSMLHPMVGEETSSSSQAGSTTVPGSSVANDSASSNSTSLLSQSPAHSQSSHFTLVHRQELPQAPQDSTDVKTPLSSSPRRYPTGLTSPIPEEADETGSESPNEPLTPVSGRQSRDFHALNHHDANSHYTASEASTLMPEQQPELSMNHIGNGFPKAPKVIQTAATPPSALRTPQTVQAPRPLSINTTAEATTEAEQADFEPTSLQQQTTRKNSSASNLKRTPSNFSIKKTMTSFFRRSNSNVTESGTKEFRDNYKMDNNAVHESTPVKVTPNSSRHFSFHKSRDTTRSNSPPSPSSPLEMAHPPKSSHRQGTVPLSGDFMDNSQKNRTSTGFLFGGKVNFAAPNKDKAKKPVRARSAERKAVHTGVGVRNPDLSHPWALAPEAGTGMKARRLSLSLPDDFTVDITELYDEYEYQHKMFGRHGKPLGKGATSKVTLMARKGHPEELYAVKEFRPKASSETTQDYENKIKSEYSIAKSLHHPNIIETISLCTHHGRFSHIMEYASEGDLFSLVSKGYLKDESRSTDRFCLFKQLIQGVNYLHSNGIAHRDIKLENLLITKDSKLKITDFGVSEVFSGIHPGLREAGGECGRGMGDVRLCNPGICGSLPYISPEVISKTDTYDPRALDVWSSAIVMVYITFGGNLWAKAATTPASDRQPNLYNALVRGWEKFNALKAKNPNLPTSEFPRFEPFDLMVKPHPLARVLMNMLNPDPAKRSTITDVINNRWVKNIECCQLESYEDPKQVIDASKKDCLKSAYGNKIYCHSHLPPQASGNGLPPMPGKAGY